MTAFRAWSACPCACSKAQNATQKLFLSFTWPDDMWLQYRGVYADLQKCASPARVIRFRLESR